MTGSALVGHPPANQDDFWIIKGFLRQSGLPDKKMHPEKGLPIHKPPHASDDERGTRLMAGMCVAMVLIVMITATRLSLRWFRKDLKWGLDDWMLIPALIGVCGQLGSVIGLVLHGGVGRHVWDLTYHELDMFFGWVSMAELLFFLSVGLVKVSITLFNRRLTGLTSKRWMIAHNVFLCLLICYLLVVVFTNVFFCNPARVHFSMVAYGSNPTPPTCLNGKVLPVFLSVMHILFDFALLSVPLVVLWKIQMSNSKKIKLCFLFSVGSVSCIGSVMRQVIQDNSNPDFTYDSIRSFQWTTVDIFFAITAASLPVLNAAIPKSWRGTSKYATPGLNYIPNSSKGGGDNSRPFRTESESTINKQEHMDLQFHSEEILHGDEKNRQPSVVQLPGFTQASQVSQVLPDTKYKPYPHVTPDAYRSGHGARDDIV